MSSVKGGCYHFGQPEEASVDLSFDCWSYGRNCIHTYWAPELLDRVTRLCFWSDRVPYSRLVLIVQAKGGITSDIVDALTKNNVTLSKMRKKRQISETLASPEEVATLDLAGSFPIHKTTQVMGASSA